MRPGDVPLITAVHGLVRSEMGWAENLTALGYRDGPRRHPGWDY